MVVPGPVFLHELARAGHEVTGRQRAQLGNPVVGKLDWPPHCLRRRDDGDLAHGLEWPQHQIPGREGGQLRQRLGADPGIDDVEHIQAGGAHLEQRVDIVVQRAARDHLDGAHAHGHVDVQPLDGRKTQCTDHREQFVEDAVQVDGRGAVEHIEAVERAVVIVEVRDEDGIPAQPAHGIEVETHGRKRMAVAAERVFDDGVEGDGRAFAFEDIAGVQDAGDFQGHG